MLTRAEQRRQRQLETEKEQRLEDDEALKMTKEQHETLLRSFQSVKFEFYDLDGLSWTDSIKQKLKRWKDTGTPTRKPTFEVLTQADLASFAPEETIRPSAVRARAAQQENGASWCNTSWTSGLGYGKRDGTRARSPVKGLFSASDTDAPSASQATLRFDTSGNDGILPPCQPTDTGAIKSIFRSSVFSPTHGRKRSQTCSVAAMPKSPPLLAPIVNMTSP